MITQLSYALIRLFSRHLVRTTLLFALAFALIVGISSTAPVRAHGGVIIDGGFTDDFEWIASVSPFPAVEGEAVLTIVIFDLEDYAPVDGLETSVFLAPPDSTAECCEEGVHQGPIALEADPELYPGDYSQIVQFDQLGDWQVRFVAGDDDRTLDAVVSISVLPEDPFAEAADETPDRAATETAFAQNINAARQSPLETPSPNQALSPLDSPLLTTGNTTAEESSAEHIKEDPVPATANDAAFSLFSTQTLIWLGIGLIPILLILLWMLRPKDKLES